MLKVLFASSEMAPFAKVGGLGDVIGSLPKALRAIGVDARVLLPLYGSINTAKYNIRPLFTFDFPRQNGTATITIYYTEYDTVTVYFLNSWPFFGDGDYIYSTWDWDMPRFIFFSQAIQATIWQLSQGTGKGSAQQPFWSPDVLHVNDWHTALGSFLLDTSRGDPQWGRMGSVLSIHNMAYQGQAAGGWLFDVNVPGRNNSDLLIRNKSDNLLAIGIMYSDVVSTVSPRYATEMQYPRFGEGLEDLIQIRAAQGNMVGILNGMDIDVWNPATDKLIPHHYTLDNYLEGRAANKAALQTLVGLPNNPNTPLIGMVSRLVDQKGIDLAIPALRRLMAEADCQVIILGTGDPVLENQVRRLVSDFGWKSRAILQYSAQVSQQIYASADLFLMPSRYEPCGTSQMLAMRYGSLPVVRETGGLADTVTNYDNGAADQGTGFMFLWEESEAVLGTLRWAVDTYRRRPQAFRRMQERAMQVDFSWHTSAHQYIAMYERTIARHRG